MGVIGQRRLEELLKKADWEMSQGTPRDIATRGLFDACAEAFEKVQELEDAEKKIEELSKRCDTQEKTETELEKRIEELEADEKVLRDERARLEDRLDDQEKRVAGLLEALAAARARIEELERGGDARERAAYLEAGLRRIMLEAWKLRRGVL